jgi:hypothetical protein
MHTDLIGTIYEHHMSRPYRQFIADERQAYYIGAGGAKVTGKSQPGSVQAGAASRRLRERVHK